jgi:hypothetical protein
VQFTVTAWPAVPPAGAALINADLVEADTYAGRRRRAFEAAVGSTIRNATVTIAGAFWDVCKGTVLPADPPQPAQRTAIAATEINANVRIYDPPTVVVVTLIGSVAVCPLPPAMVNVQLPAATGVTVNVVALVAAIVAIPAHECATPTAAVDAVNAPV